jgi:UDP-N-acetyl-2-amino-2-deoxyglucuronate dehydrogenase
MSSAVRVGIIGCGRISGHHCRSIIKTAGAELVAVCDLDISKAEVYRDEFGVTAYKSYHQMLQDQPSINTVAIVTPSGMHFEHALEVIQRYRKNIIVEKPTFMKPSQVESAYEAARQAGVRIFPVFQNRHNLAVQRVFKGIRDGELGAIRSAAVRVRWCRPQRYYDLAPWRGTFSMDGGCLTNQGVHHIDLLRKLGGEVLRVCSTHRTLGAQIEVEDTATAVFEFMNGAIGSLEITTAARPIDFEASLSLVCENGLAQIGGIAVNELQIYTPEPTACVACSEDFSGNVYGNGHQQMYSEIVTALTDGSSFSVEYEDVLASMRLLNAFYRSDESAGWVSLSDTHESDRLGRIDEKLANLYRTVIN